MNIDEPTFTYKDPSLTEEQKRGLEEAQHNPPPLRIAEALTSEAAQHQWEHKTLADGAFIRNRQDLGRLLGNTQGRVRTFTREEVLTVLRTLHALNMSVAAAINAFSQME